MIRAFLDAALVFLIPFAIFAVGLAILRRNPLHRAHWPPRRVMLLVGAGLACVVASFVLTGLFVDRQTGAFVPTHMENGRVVPGQFR